VSDTGIGICEEDLQQLGRPFMQVQNDYTRKFEGTGLGLSLVKGLVALHGGAMSIESAPGAGTTVTVTLPADGAARGSGKRPAAIPAKIANEAPDETERKTACAG
jgi:cell cycle sensor histidine kinase DivJ